MHMGVMGNTVVIWTYWDIAYDDRTLQEIRGVWRRHREFVGAKLGVSRQYWE